MQYIIPYLQAREGFQVRVIIWSLGELGKTEKKHKLDPDDDGGDYDDDDDDDDDGDDGGGGDDDDDDDDDDDKFHFD